MRYAFRKMYKDDRGWLYVVKERKVNGKCSFSICCHKKNDAMYGFRKVKGMNTWNTQEEAEKELKEYAESRKMKSVF